RGCARGGSAWIARCCLSAPTRRASRCRRQAATKGRSFEHPNAVTELGGELEVFVFHRPPELLLEVEQAKTWIVGAFAARRDVGLAAVLARAVEPAEQVAQVRTEGLVTLRAAEPARFAEVLEGAPARRA